MVDEDTLITQWLNGLSRLHRGHFAAAKACELNNVCLGVPVIVLTTIVGSAVFSSVQSDTSTSTKIIVGVLSITAAVLSGLQTFLKFSERAARHKVTATKYGILRRELEQAIALTGGRKLEKSFMDSLRARWDSLDEESPTVPERLLPH